MASLYDYNNIEGFLVIPKELSKPLNVRREVTIYSQIKRVDIGKNLPGWAVRPKPENDIILIYDDNVTIGKINVGGNA